MSPLKEELIDWLSNQDDDDLWLQIQQLRDHYEPESTLTSAQKEELDRRIQRLENGESKLIPWAEVKADLLKHGKDA